MSIVCLAGEKEAVVDAAKTAFICHHQPAADGDDVSIGNDHHDNLATVDAVSESHMTFADQSLPNSSVCPADR